MSPPSHQQLTIIGATSFHGTSRSFGVRLQDRLAHMWILGKTGSGKSTLLENLIVQDLRAGRGLMLIDPHGDLVRSVLNFVPDDRRNDVISFDPGGSEPLAFNPFDAPDVEPLLRASAILGAIKKTWPSFWGARMEYILRTSILTLVGVPGVTLLDLHRLLVDPDFRKTIVARVSDPALLDFWHKEFPNYTGPFRSEAVAPILNKTGQYITHPILRAVLGQPKSSFSLRHIIDNAGVVLANFSKGRLGEDVTSLLGSLLVSQLELAALTRSDIAEQDREPFFLFVDEAQLIATETMVELFPEARKFGLGVVLANQYVDQFDQGLRAALLGNVGSLIVFRLGAPDAHALIREFSPEFEELDLIDLPAFQVAIRLLVDGVPARPFTGITFPPPRTIP